MLKIKNAASETPPSFQKNLVNLVNFIKRIKESNDKRELEIRGSRIRFRYKSKLTVNE